MSCKTDYFGWTYDRATGEEFYDGSGRMRQFLRCRNFDEVECPLTIFLPHPTTPFNSRNFFAALAKGNGVPTTLKVGP